ncbi:hypothetical protein HDU97_008137 [Phlyctochytrium planicorne]|nr:hypothetical protein HDU97_008137 [Phlyctochytrium planicorne]
MLEMPVLAASPVIGASIHANELSWNELGNGMLAMGQFDGISFLGEVRQEVWEDNLTRVILKTMHLAEANTSLIDAMTGKGTVTGACIWKDQTPKLILTGSFNQIGDMSKTSNIVSVDLETGRIKTLDDSLDLPRADVSTLFCDSGTNSIWLGSSAIPGGLARLSNEVWSASNYFPGGGLDGTVNDIIRVPGMTASDEVKDSYYVVGSFSGTVYGDPMGVQFRNRLRYSASSLNDGDILDQKTISCPSQTTDSWKSRSRTRNSSLIIDFPHLTNVTALTLYESVETKNQKTIQLFTYPGNTPLLLRDPSTGALCQKCLFESNKSVLSLVIQSPETDIQQLRLELTEVKSGEFGLNAIEFFQRDGVVYADPEHNPVRCGDVVAVAESRFNGNWRSIVTDNNPSMLLASNRNSVNDASLLFFPGFSLKGIYDIVFEYPPCGIFDKCAARTNVTLELFKLNENQDPVAAFDIDQRSNATITIAFRSTFSSTSANDVYVRMRIPRISTSGSRVVSVVATSLKFLDRTVIKDLNGLAQLNINIVGTPSWLPFDDKLYVSGSFEATSSKSIAMHYVAEYFLNTGVWREFDVGIKLKSPPKLSFDSSSNVMYISSANGLGFLRGWNLATGKSVDLGYASGSIDFSLSTATATAETTYTVVAGRVKSFQAFSQRNSSIIRPNNEPISVNLTGLSMEGVVSGLVDSDSPNALLLYGQFSVNGTMQGLVSYNMDTASFVYPGISVFGTVNDIVRVDQTYWIGGQFDSMSTTTSKTPAGSLAVWQKLNPNLVTPFPFLEGENLKSPIIKKIVHLPYRKEIVVFGQFKGRSDLICNNVCIWSLESSAWRPAKFEAGTKLEISNAYPYKNKIVLSGNLLIEGKSLLLASWNPNNDQLLPIDDIPGPVTAMGLSADGGKLLLSGISTDKSLPFFVKWDGGFSSRLNFDISTVIKGMMALPTNETKNPPIAVLFGSISLNNTQRYSSMAIHENGDVSPFILSSFNGTYGYIDHIIPFQPPPLQISGSDDSNSSTSPAFIGGIIAVFAFALICLAGIFFFFAKKRGRLPCFRARPRSQQSSTLSGGGSSRYDRDSAESIMSFIVENYKSVHLKDGSYIDMDGNSTKLSPGSATSDLLAPSTEKKEISRSSTAVGTEIGGMSQEGESAANIDPQSPMEGHDIGSDTPHQWGVALYPFHSSEPGELQFEKGDTILVIDSTDPHWWMGMVDDGENGTIGTIGVFPANYIETI